MTLTAEDRTLLADVIRWGRANGWHSYRYDPDGADGEGRMWENDRSDASVAVLDDDDGMVKVCALAAAEDANVDVWPSSVQQAVDVLCALGVLPVEFSSAYRAGVESVHNGGDIEWAIRVDVPHPRRSERAGDLIRTGHPDVIRRCRELWDGWTPLRRSTGPWVPDVEQEAGR